MATRRMLSVPKHKGRPPSCSIVAIKRNGEIEMPKKKESIGFRANKIAHIMLDLKLNKQDLAYKAGVSPQTVFNLFAGKDAKISSLKKISKALKINWKDMLDDDLVFKKTKR